MSIDGSGNFSGYGWGENIGWINFANTTPAYKVVTTWISGVTTYIPGDVSGDGKVSLDDAMLVLRILAGIPVGNVNLNADVNGDGRIGLEELGYILQKAAELRQ